MDAILNSLPTYMMIGIIVVIGVSQFNRIAGGVLGIIFWSSVAIIGSYAYERGGGIGLPGFKFPQPLFYAICALFIGLSALTSFVAYKKKSSARPPELRTDDEDD